MKDTENEVGVETGKIRRKIVEEVDLVTDIEAGVETDVAGIGKEVRVKREREAEVKIGKGNTEVGAETVEVEADIEAGKDILEVEAGRD